MNIKSVDQAAWLVKAMRDADDMANVIEKSYWRDIKIGADSGTGMQEAIIDASDDNKRILSESLRAIAEGYRRQLEALGVTGLRGEP